MVWGGGGLLSYLIWDSFMVDAIHSALTYVNTRSDRHI